MMTVEAVAVDAGPAAAALLVALDNRRRLSRLSSRLRGGDEG